MKNYRWRAALILLGAVILLGIIATASRAQASTWVHGIVQDDGYQPVAGGTIRIQREYNGQWYNEYPPAVMAGHAFGWTLRRDGRYRVAWSKKGWAVTWIRDGEFTVPGAPTGDIAVHVQRVAPPTATPTVTATPDAPCLSFQQFSYAERRSVVASSAQHIGKPLEAVLEWDSDPTLIHGLNEQLLGAPVTTKFTVMGLTARAFCNGILTMRPEPREQCLGYGIITWDGTQNWMAE